MEVGTVGDHEVLQPQQPRPIREDEDAGLPRTLVEAVGSDKVPCPNLLRRPLRRHGLFHALVRHSLSRLHHLRREGLPLQLRHLLHFALAGEADGEFLLDRPIDKQRGGQVPGCRPDHDEEHDAKREYERTSLHFPTSTSNLLGESSFQPPPSCDSRLLFFFNPTVGRMPSARSSGPCPRGTHPPQRSALDQRRKVCAAAGGPWCTGEEHISPWTDKSGPSDPTTLSLPAHGRPLTLQPNLNGGIVRVPAI